MAKFESSIGSRNLGNSNMRNLEIPDEDSKESSLEKQFQEARDAKKGVSRLSDGAKRRIEMLTGMSRITRTITLDGNDYTFRSLTSKELEESLMASSKYDGTVSFLFEMRKHLLSRSVTEVAGLDISQFLGSNDLSAKLEFLDELDEALLSRLYDEYMSVAKEAKEKYSVKSVADIKEVVEDLKK